MSTCTTAVHMLCRTWASCQHCATSGCQLYLLPATTIQYEVQDCSEDIGTSTVPHTLGTKHLVSTSFCLLNLMSYLTLQGESCVCHLIWVKGTHSTTSLEEKATHHLRSPLVSSYLEDKVKQSGVCVMQLHCNINEQAHITWSERMCRATWTMSS